ncbi:MULTISPECIES: hypothetical protein [unclassified Vibrio]|uniref:hypothetical protein n=1 Tax=unclassified Vibrio TaxID=2614977 RepID=UPI001361D23D|nr:MULTISPECIES: hypothetical protein [unclassified Vibrio]NAW57028.1 hypothetical protein [Vibrio sp. V36_P2S2PM302]NAX22227.1 hypothetical protein [Vibrio sp. V39_P1S14PM300]NAX26443.1 hypothetical protein [Vibrio sp. V38_P2S17PM301]NAX32610.1 hypothetical protein [Vibrio sp. V37_P2S8PM304]
MVRIILVLAVLMQLFVATQTQGLIRSVVELSAFLLVVVLMLNAKRRSPPVGH